MTMKRQIVIKPPRKRFLKRRGNDEEKNSLDEERKKRWAEEALRERRKRFEDHYQSVNYQSVTQGAHQRKYLVDIKEDEIEEYEAFLDDIIENANNLPVSKKRKERPDESFQFEKENYVPSTKSSMIEIRKLSSSLEHRTVLAEYNQLHCNIPSLSFTSSCKEGLATDVDFGEESNINAPTGEEPFNSFATGKDQNHQMLYSSSEPTMLSSARNGNTAIITIKNFHRNDVICDRKGSFCNHPGNIYFQKLVKERMQKYLKARKKDKRLVAAEVVDQIRKLDPPGRFLKKHDFICGYIDIGDDKANEKTIRALREENYVKSLAKNASNRKNQHSIVLPDTLVPTNENTTNIDLHEETISMDSTNSIVGENGHVTTKEDHTPLVLEPLPSELNIPPRDQNGTSLSIYPNENTTLIAKEAIHDHDVLCGRGGSVGAHPGNKFFQKLIKERKQIYLNSRKLEKKSVATEVVDLVRKLDPPGRFLKRDDETGCYIEISNSKANEKTRQALRENAPSLRSQMELETRELVRNQMELEAREIEIGIEKGTVNTPVIQHEYQHFSFLQTEVEEEEACMKGTWI